MPKTKRPSLNQPQTQKHLKDSENAEQENGTISVDKLNDQLQTLMHEIGIASIQDKLKQHEAFFKNLGDNTEILFEMIQWYKEKRAE